MSRSIPQNLFALHEISPSPLNHSGKQKSRSRSNRPTVLARYSSATPLSHTNEYQLLPPMLAELVRNSLPLTLTNPQNKCQPLPSILEVIVKDGKIISTGFSRELEVWHRSPSSKRNDICCFCCLHPAYQRDWSQTFRSFPLTLREKNHPKLLWFLAPLFRRNRKGNTHAEQCAIDKLLAQKVNCKGEIPSIFYRSCFYVQT